MQKEQKQAQSKAAILANMNAAKKGGVRNWKPPASARRDSFMVTVGGLNNLSAMGLNSPAKKAASLAGRRSVGLQGSMVYTGLRR